MHYLAVAPSVYHAVQGGSNVWGCGWCWLLNETGLPSYVFQFFSEKCSETFDAWHHKLNLEGKAGCHLSLPSSLRMITSRFQCPRLHLISTHCVLCKYQPNVFFFSPSLNVLDLTNDLSLLICDSTTTCLNLMECLCVCLSRWWRITPCTRQSDTTHPSAVEDFLRNNSSLTNFTAFFLV